MEWGCSQEPCANTLVRLFDSTSRKINVCQNKKRQRASEIKWLPADVSDCLTTSKEKAVLLIYTPTKPLRARWVWPMTQLLDEEGACFKR